MTKLKKELNLPLQLWSSNKLHTYNHNLSNLHKLNKNLNLTPVFKHLQNLLLKLASHPM